MNLHTKGGRNSRRIPSFHRKYDQIVFNPDALDDAGLSGLLHLEVQLQSMKLDLQMKKTGETGVIQGIRIEDNLIVLSMEGRNAAGVATPFRVEVHEWLASASELGRIPALSGMAGCSQGAESSNPEAILQTILGQMPGATAKIG